MTLLKIENLQVRIGAACVIDGLELDLARGEILGLAGESGSGKSMTARAVLGLLPSGARQEGRVLFKGLDLTGKSDAEMRVLRGQHIGLVSQEPLTALNPVLTIGAQVAEVIALHRPVGRAEAMAQARAVLDRVGLPEQRFPSSRYPHELSGGQRQRVAIAIAVALKPDLLIADEPTTALDVTTQAQILALLRRLADEDGIGVILITHDFAVVAEIADRVAVMRRGSLIETGEIPGFFRQMSQPYSLSLRIAADHRPVRAGRDVGKAATVLSARGIVRDFSTGKGTFRAVDRVDLDIRAGETVGLVGESGSGKSTLLRTLLAFDRPETGDVRLGGEIFSSTRAADMRRLRRKIQVVLQDPFGSFDPRWRVERLIGESFHLLDERPSPAQRRRRIEEMLERVGLSPADADKYPHEFSGGQRQRLAIARALLTEPAVVALDEAVSALDVTIRAQILDLLADLSDQRGIAYLFVTHDLSVVRAIADRVMVMQAGRIVESGETAALFAAPQHPYTQALLAATPDIERALARR